MSVIDDDTDRRAAVLDGLREMVALFEKNPDLIPVAGVRVTSGTTDINEWLLNVGRVGKPTKRYNTPLHRGVERDFGGNVILDVYVSHPVKKGMTR